MSLSNSTLNENITLKKVIKGEVNAIEGEAKSVKQSSIAFTSPLITLACDM